MSTSGVLVTTMFFSFAVIKSILSTPLPKFAINFNLTADLRTEESIVSLMHGTRISAISTFFLSSL